MLFTFPTATFASTFGAALLAATSPYEVAASVNYANEPTSDGSLRTTQVQGAECTFVNALEADNGVPDTGLLTCEEFETCIEDESSAAGGRCVDSKDQVAIDASRNLYDDSCVKCQGYYACPSDINLDNIGCNSCIGRLACYHLHPSSTIGENSCFGSKACYGFNGSVGDNSCASGDGKDCASYYAYKKSAPIPYPQAIGNNSCNGQYACYILYKGAAQVAGFDKSVGDFSCNGKEACSYLYYAVGKNSCNGSYACWQSDYKNGGTFPYNEKAYFGDCVCNGSMACSRVGGGYVNYIGNECSSAPSASSAPSIEASSAPSIVASSAPSIEASSEPSIQASSAPSIEASSAPSIEASSAPSVAASSAPSVVASSAPSIQASSAPSIQASSEPSIQASLQSAPSSAPSGKPIVSARKIKIDSITGQQIQMFEFEVFSSGTNIVVGKDTAQSSTFKNKAGFQARKAADGNMRTFSHTGDSNAWWQLDLGAMYPIDSITIKNRWCKSPDDPTNCLCRLSRSVLSMWNDEGNWVATEVIGDTCGVPDINITLPSLAKCDGV